MARENGLLTAALAVSVALVFLLSPFALTALGFEYSDTGGGALTKFHPATFYLCALVALVALATGNPLAAALRAVQETPAVLAVGLAIAVGTLHASLVSGLPVTPLIETFLPAALALVLLGHLPEKRGQTLGLLVHAFMISNALLALYEFHSGWRLTPFVLEGEVLVYEWRSTALLGHPLANALLTGSYILILALGGGRDLSPPLRLAAFLLSLAVMPSFGGRAATVLMLAMLAAIGGGIALRMLRGAPIRFTTVLAGLICIPLAGVGLLILASTGYMEQFLDRFAYDSGSSQTRSDMFEIFTHVSWADLLFGPDQRLVETWQGLLGLERGIESFWLSLTFFYGLLVTLVILAALFLLCREIVRRCRPGAAWVLTYFIGVSSFSVSLAGKSSILTAVTLLLLILMRRGQIASPR